CPQPQGRIRVVDPGLRYKDICENMVESDSEGDPTEEPESRDYQCCSNFSEHNNSQGLPNESRLSCGALKKDSFLIYARRQLQALVRRHGSRSSVPQSQASRVNSTDLAVPRASRRGDATVIVDRDDTSL